MVSVAVHIQCGVGLAVGRQPSKLICTGLIPVPRCD